MDYKQVRAFARSLRKNQTPAEKYFWEKVRDRRFLGKKFNRQFVIQHEEIQNKKKFFIADFFCHEKRLVVELDGKIHLQQLDYDRIRENILREMGFQIIRFDNAEVLHEWGTVEKKLEEVLNSSPGPFSWEEKGSFGGDEGG
jgi:very-short-patch-repair endonuclease